MKVVNLPFIYELGSEMQELSKLKYDGTGKSRLDILIAANSVGYSIYRLLEEYPALTVSRNPGKDLLTAIDKIRAWYQKIKNDLKPNLDAPDFTVDYDFNEVISKANVFTTILKADLLENLVAYHPQQKGIYSTALLITQAENALHPEYLRKLDETVVREIRESGKCLAFDNYTASGFHMLRALEIVLHDYYVLICNPEDTKKHLDSWGAYLDPLYKFCRDECTTLSAKDGIVQSRLF